MTTPHTSCNLAVNVTPKFLGWGGGLRFLGIAWGKGGRGSEMFILVEGHNFVSRRGCRGGRGRGVVTAS